MGFIETGRSLCSDYLLKLFLSNDARRDYG